MINSLFSVLCIILRIHQVFGEDFTEICSRNDKIVCVNAFRYNQILALFCTIDGKTSVIRVKLAAIIGETAEIDTNLEDFWPKPNSDAIQKWDDWHRTVDGTHVTNITQFVSAFDLDLPNLSYTLVFTVQDPEYLEAKYLIGYYVSYDSDVRAIKSVKKFFIDPYRANTTGDVIDLRLMYQFFPNDFQDMVTPIVALPQRNQLWRQLFVYYYEANLEKPEETSYRIHVFNQSIATKQWRYNSQPFECVDLDPKIKVLASVIVYPFHSQQSQVESKNFFLMEFFDNGKYGLKRVMIDSTTDQIDKTSVKNPIKSGDIRELLCDTSRTEPITDQTPTDAITNDQTSDIPTKSEPPFLTNFTLPFPYNPTTTTERLPPFLSNFTIPMGAVGATAQQSKNSSESKSSKWWIYLVVILVLIVIAALIAFCIYTCKKRSQAQKSSDTDSSDSDDHIPKPSKDSVEK